MVNTTYNNEITYEVNPIIHGSVNIPCKFTNSHPTDTVNKIIKYVI